MSVKNFSDQMREEKVKLRVSTTQADRLVTIPSTTQRLIRPTDSDGRMNDETSVKLHGIR